MNVHRETIGRVLLQGVEAAWPICVGYVPLGLALGVVAQKAGLSALEVGLMSLLVFAGSAQFIAVSMMQGGAGLPAIVVTTFMVNLRHLLMSSSLAVHLKGRGRAFLGLFAYGVTDESFAVNLTRFRERIWTPREALVVNHVANSVWIFSTILGCYGGQFIGEKSFGIDYALVAMFISLIVLQARGPLYVITAIMAGLMAVVLSWIIPKNGHVVVASIAAASLGFILKRRYRKRFGYEPQP